MPLDKFLRTSFTSARFSVVTTTWANYFQRIRSQHYVAEYFMNLLKSQMSGEWYWYLIFRENHDSMSFCQSVSQGNEKKWKTWRPILSWHSELTTEAPTSGCTVLLNKVSCILNFEVLLELRNMPFENRQILAYSHLSALVCGGDPKTFMRDGELESDGFTTSNLI